jgi:hypothetical protein
MTSLSSYYLSLESVNKNMSKNPKLIFFFDWDDTLIASSILDDYGLFRSNTTIPNNVLNSLKKCEEIVCQILMFAKSLTDHVYIITNSKDDWVSYSINRFYPTLKNSGVMDDIPILYGREHEHAHPDPMFWKYQTMVDILNRVIDPNATNDQNEQNKIKVISIGDAIFERNALLRIGRERDSIVTKIIKMIDWPETFDHLYIQLNGLNNTLDSIVSNTDPCDLMTSIDTIGNNLFVKIIQNDTCMGSPSGDDRDRQPNIPSNCSQGLDAWHYKWADHWKSYYELKTSKSNNIDRAPTKTNNTMFEPCPSIFLDKYGLDMIDEKEITNSESNSDDDSDSDDDDSDDDSDSDSDSDSDDDSDSDSDSDSDDDNDLNQTSLKFVSIDLINNDDAMDIDP